MRLLYAFDCPSLRGRRSKAPPCPDAHDQSDAVTSTPQPRLLLLPCSKRNFELIGKAKPTAKVEKCSGLYSACPVHQGRSNNPIRAATFQRDLALFSNATDDWDSSCGC